MDKLIWFYSCGCARWLFCFTFSPYVCVCECVCVCVCVCMCRREGGVPGVPDRRVSKCFQRKNLTYELRKKVFFIHQRKTGHTLVQSRANTLISTHGTRILIVISCHDDSWVPRCVIISLKAGPWPLTPAVAESSLALPQRGHIRTVVCPLPPSPPFVSSIAPHLPLTFTLCLLQTSLWCFLLRRCTYSARAHTKQRADMSYEPGLSSRKSRQLIQLTCNFLLLLVLWCWVMNELNISISRTCNDVHGRITERMSILSPRNINKEHIIKYCNYIRFEILLLKNTSILCHINLLTPLHTIHRFTETQTDRRASVFPPPPSFLLVCPYLIPLSLRKSACICRFSKPVCLSVFSPCVKPSSSWKQGLHPEDVKLVLNSLNQ